MLPHLMLPDILNVTSLQESEDGATPSDLQDGPIHAHAGLLVAPANLSARRAKELGLLMSGTYGPLPIGSSLSEGQSQSLVSRLRARLDSRGSILFRLIWKERRTPLGRPIFALRASVLRTSGRDCTGVPTPDIHKCGGPQNPIKRKAGGHSIRLQDCASLASLPTPCFQDGPNGGPSQGIDRLPGCASLASLPTPQAGSPATETYNEAGNTDYSRLGRQAQLADGGQIAIGGMGETKSIGQLNPAYSRWLMGFPAVWDDCADMAMQLFRNSRRHSSKLRKAGRQ